MKSKTTLTELYKRYKYPCWDITLLESNIVPVPYIPKDKLRCDHKFALDYQTWRKIVVCIFKYMMLYLEEGLELKLPHRLGYFQLKKRRATSLDKLHLVATGEARRKRHVETSGYKPILKWKRFNDSAYLKHKSIWKINLLRGQWSRLIKELQKDYSKINKLIDV